MPTPSTRQVNVSIQQRGFVCAGFYGNYLRHPVVAKKYNAGPKSIQTPVPFRPPAGRNPDWSITIMFMQLSTQLIHYNILICIIICYKPKGNIIIRLSPLELKSDLSLLMSLIWC